MLFSNAGGLTHALGTVVQYGQPTKVVFFNTSDTLVISLSHAIAHRWLHGAEERQLSLGSASVRFALRCTDITLHFQTVSLTSAVSGTSEPCKKQTVNGDAAAQLAQGAQAAAPVPSPSQAHLVPC